MDLVVVPISISAVCARRAAILRRMSIRTRFFLLASFVAVSYTHLSDELRDGLCGPVGDKRKGAFLAGIPGGEMSVKFGIAGAIAVSYTHLDVYKRQVHNSPALHLCGKRA